jgi:hypothetical protein
MWANFRALIGIFNQSVGPSLATWANPVQVSFCGANPTWCTHPPVARRRRSALPLRARAQLRDTPRAEHMAEGQAKRARELLSDAHGPGYGDRFGQ